MYFSWKNSLKALPVLLLLGAYAGAAFGAAGNVQFVIGDVKLTTKAGVSRALKKGEEINEGDRVITAAGASAQIKMVDGGFIAVRPNTDMGFDTYRYSGKEDGTENAIVSLLRGGFRTITGVIGRTNKHNYLVTTETATIGIRGTDHEPMVILPPAPGQVAIAAAGTYDKVNVGIAFIRTDAGSIDIHRNQVGFAPISKAAPVILPRIPPFYKPTPAPGPQKAKEESKKDSQQAGAAPAKSAEEQKPATVAEKPAEAPAPVRATAVVDPTSTVPAAPAAVAVAAPPASVAPVVPITATGAHGEVLNITTETIASASGTIVVPVTEATVTTGGTIVVQVTNTVITPEGPIVVVTTVPLSEGAYAAQAQTAADQALASYNATQAAISAITTAQTDTSAKAGTAAALSPVSLAPATSAISSAQSAITSAQSAVAAAQALAPANAATATANAAAAASLSSSAATLASTATGVYAANGSLADATAVTAKVLMDSANTVLQAASSSVQKAAGVVADPNSVTAQNAALASAQNAAVAALGTASTSLSSANTALTNATAQNASLATAQTAASSATGSIPGFLATAQSAASSAQAASQAAQAAATQALSLQSAGDLTGAQAKLVIAQEQFAIAQEQQAAAVQAQTLAQGAASTAAAQLTAAQSAVAGAQTEVGNAVTAASTVGANAATAASKLADAQAAKTGADAALATTASGLATVQANAPTVQQNAVLAQYNNPAPGANRYGHGMLATKAVAGGVELQNASNNNFNVNTTYVLDGGKNLVEVRRTEYFADAYSYSPSPDFVADANVKFSGGTAKDAFAAADSSVYLGRWQGGRMVVTDLAATSPLAPFTIPLGAASAHWLLLSMAASPYNSVLSGTSSTNMPIDYPQTLTGTASYALTAATHPTDSLGNVGTLNSATVAANFSKQTLDVNLGLAFVNNPSDPVAPSNRAMAFAASTTNVPISHNGFTASLPVTCSGADCAASYIGIMQGGIAGAAARSIGLGYGFTPVVSTPAATQPYTDFIQGTAFLSSSTAPTQGAVASSVSEGTSQFRHQAFTQVNDPSTGNVYLGIYNLPSGASANASNYLFDAAGNLVRIQYTPYSVSDRGTSVTVAGTPGGSAPAPLGATTISFHGGFTPDGNYNDSVNGIRMGRYTGGFVTTTDFATQNTFFTQLGDRSLNWAVREVPATIPVTGNFEYTPAYATKPTDSLGNVGFLNSASLAVNFDTQTVNPAVSVSINNQNLTAAAANVPIGTGFGFNVSANAAQNPTPGGSAVQVQCFGSNCAPAPSTGGNNYGARFNGGFAGNGTAGGAFFRYNFVTRFDSSLPADVSLAAGRPINDYIEGLVGFTKGTTSVAAPAPATATTGDQAIATSYWQFQAATGTSPSFYQSHHQTYNPSSAGYTSDFGTGSPNTVTDFDPSKSTPRSETLTGGTVVEGPANATSFAATGVSFGRYGLSISPPSPGFNPGGTLSGTDSQGNAFSFANPGIYAWIKGPSPELVTKALTGSAKYVFDGGTVPSTVTGGQSGVVNSAVLALDFNKSAVGVDLSVSIPSTSTTWTATSTPSGALTGTPATNIKLGGDSHFSANSFDAVNNPAQHQSLFVNRTIGTVSSGVNINVGGDINGQLIGSNLSGAGMVYAFQDSSTPAQGVNGAVAFALNSYTKGTTTTNGTSAIDPNNIPYIVGLAAAGLVADPTATPANAPASVDSSYLAQVDGQVLASGRTNLGANGLPTEWDGRFPITEPPPAGCPGCSANVNDAPARFSIDPARFVVTGTAPGSGQVALPALKSIASVLESGIDASTGIRWGRYGGGVVAVFDRVGGGFAPKTVDLSTQNLHFILGPMQAGPAMLPTTGTFSYTNVGGTSPTDNLGGVGVLNAATLSANFTAQTVDASVNATVTGTNIIASGAGLPIQKGLFFEAQKPLSGAGNLSMSCSGGSCNPAAMTGRVTGTFTGTTGQGATMAYSLNSGGTLSPSFLPGQTISGVAAFKR